MGWQTFIATVFQAGNTIILNSSGLFIYNGPPALGNLSFSIAVTAGVDSVGNGYAAGINAYGSGGAAVTIEPSGPESVILIQPGNAAHSTESPQIFGATLNAGAANEFMEGEFTSGTSGSHDDAALQVFSESADTTLPAVSRVVIGGTIITQNSKTLMNINTPITATAGTTANPTVITSDTWNKASALDGTWAASGVDVNGLWYRLTNDNELEINFSLLNTAAVGNATVVTFTGIYIPKTPQSAAMAWNNPGTTPPWCGMDASGNFFIDSYSAANKVCWGHVFFALDTL